jgi:hypothetical protein
MTITDAQRCAYCTDALAEIETIMLDRLAAIGEELEQMRARCLEAEELAGRRLDRIYELVLEVRLST